jgi:N-acylglucosamine 2-epimerase
MWSNEELYDTYRRILAEGIIPFWWGRALDRQYGGVFSCMQEDGTLLSTDKYTWSQARFVWTLSALYNRFQPRPEFLAHARKTIDFLLEYARDSRGRFVYRTTREGRVLEGATSIYADCFVVYGITEYCRAARDRGLLRFAIETFHAICARVEEPDFWETAPYVLPPGHRPHAIPMILTEVGNELAEITDDSEIEAATDRCAAVVMSRFLRPDRKLLLEFLNRDYDELPAGEGTLVIPGHAIESMWFIMRWAMRRGHQPVIALAAEACRWHLEGGWDPEYGGLFLAIDAEGGAPALPHADKKLWWPHTEALYAVLLARHLTGEQWCEDWYRRIHDWSFAHFPMAQGEWRQRLDRRGNPVTDVIALPVKDPFHLPRAAILILDLLRPRRTTANQLQR